MFVAALCVCVSFTTPNFSAGGEDSAICGISDHCYSISKEVNKGFQESLFGEIPLVLNQSSDLVHKSIFQVNFIAQQRDFKIRRQFDRNLLSQMVGDPYFSFQEHILFTIISILSKND